VAEARIRLFRASSEAFSRAGHPGGWGPPRGLGAGPRLGSRQTRLVGHWGAARRTVKDTATRNVRLPTAHDGGSPRLAVGGQGVLHGVLSRADTLPHDS